ncbi:hypothetical protein OIDMADRAFT_20028 [Oidiodendron maius Zn]|uniref:Uncharacterized protein n=1 Tax=Oidiodendron maius (strain Zn) TaxID=913774 RepID=A0A0C3H829_OIDMZ|nr:hypothetical protein OIDMADRAFT_20028 [Oidiodendron maius Zn]
MDMPQSKKPWYSRYYDSTLHWVEDTYLKYFGENRTSYGVKDSLRKTEVTGNKDVDGIQRNIGDTAGNVFATEHVGGQVGDAVDKGVLRGNV